ncbi:hypothetical protein [Symbiobacterium terraclitae]|uniref:hypothetical protein n=1 Tax=Symbiobacterium terraclitae TaxID=557451 RepID=UPI0035B55562
MNEDALRSLLADAAAACHLPPEFDRPGGIVLTALAERRLLARRRMVVRTAAAAAVVAAVAALGAVPPVRDALASIFRISVPISILPGTLEEHLESVEIPQSGPPEEIWRKAAVDVGEALRQVPFLPAQEQEGWRLVQEYAHRQVSESGDRWEIGRELNYDLTYERNGDQIHVNQWRVVASEVVHPPETVATTLGGYPAYVSTRGIGLGEDGNPAVTDWVSISVYIPTHDDDSEEIIKVIFHSLTVPLEEVWAFAERFVSR